MAGALVFHIKPGNKEVEIANPESLAQRSVKLRYEIRRARASRQPVTLTTDEPIINAHSLEYVLEYLQHDFADAGGDQCDAKALAEVCNVLVEYQCDPRSFQGLWDKVYPRSSLVPLPSSDPRSSSRSLEGSRTSSSDGVQSVRCWRTKLPRHAATTAGQLTVAALVLGQQEALQRELGIAVWALDTELHTSLAELKDLNTMRLKEKKVIFGVLKEELTKLCFHQEPAMKKLAADIARKLEVSGLGKVADKWEDNCRKNPNLERWNPYKLIREYEKAIKPPDPRPRATHSRTPSHEDEDSRYGPSFDGLGEAIENGFNRIFKRNSATDNAAATVEEIFNEVEAKVKRNQRKRAAELMSMRNSMVIGWLATLDGGKGKGKGKAVEVLPPGQRLINSGQLVERDEGGSSRQRHVNGMDEFGYLSRYS